MMISTKGRYALRIMLDLAQNEHKGYVSVSDVSSRQGISVKYLETIVSILNRAGYVESMRGKNGGYKLTKKTTEYTVGSVLKLTEGSLAPVNCLQQGSNKCAKEKVCLTLPIWVNLDKIVDDYLESVTLYDLLNQ